MVLGLTQALGWPTLGLIVVQAPWLLAFALAALLGRLSRSSGQQR